MFGKNRRYKISLRQSGIVNVILAQLQNKENARHACDCFEKAHCFSPLLSWMFRKCPSQPNVRKQAESANKTILFKTGAVRS